MISDLIVNIAILTSFTFIWHHFLKYGRLSSISERSRMILDGCIGGLLGIILMYYSIKVNEITILDLRHIPLILVAYYGGALPAFLTAAIISIGRFSIDVNFSSIVALIMAVVMAIGAGFISYYIKEQGLKKWTALLMYSQAIYTLALYIVLEQFWQVWEIAIYHIFSALIGGYLTFYFVSYIRNYAQLYSRYKENSQRDSLTGLYNVRSFDYFYNLMLDKVKGEGGSCAICLVDIDYFKRVNDTYGHVAGDQILKQLAQLLRKIVGEEKIISRNGGEEFSILLENCDLNEARKVAEALLKEVENHFFILPNKKQLRLTVSIGIAVFGNDRNHEINLYEAADDALYKAKRAGRNTVSSR